MFFFYYFNELTNKLKGCILTPVVCSLNRYKAKVSDLLPSAVMDGLLTSRALNGHFSYVARVLPTLKSTTYNLGVPENLIFKND